MALQIGAILAVLASAGAQLFTRPLTYAAAPLAYAPGPLSYAAGRLAYAPARLAYRAPLPVTRPPPAPIVDLRREDDNDYDPNPSYDFSYSINDPLTGDSKSQSESRQGDSVQGSYSLVEPDGSRRIVEYRADPGSGFQAIVRKEEGVPGQPVTNFGTPPFRVPATVPTTLPPLATGLFQPVTQELLDAAEPVPVATRLTIPLAARPTFAVVRPPAASPAEYKVSFSSPYATYSI